MPEKGICRPECLTFAFLTIRSRAKNGYRLSPEEMETAFISQRKIRFYVRIILINWICLEILIDGAWLKQQFLNYSFPKDPTTKEKWIDATGRGPNWFPVQRNVICSEHFQEEYYQPLNKSRRLFEWAIPTLKICHIISSCSSNPDVTLGKSPNSSLVPLTKGEFSENLTRGTCGTCGHKITPSNENLNNQGQSSQTAEDSSLEDEDVRSDMEDLSTDEEREEALHMAQEYLEWEERERTAEVNKASEAWRANQLKKMTDRTTKATSKKRKLNATEEPEINATEGSCGFECSECPKQLTGKLSWCIQCAVLLCTVCERSHAAHYVLRAPPNRPPGELEQVMASIRPVVEHIVESTAAPQTSIEANTDPLLIPKEEPDDEEISIEIEETPTQFIYPNIVTYQTLDSKHTVTSATQEETVTSTRENSSPSQVPPYTSTLKPKRALSERIKPKKSVEKTPENPPTVCGLKKQTNETAPYRSILKTESVEIETSTSGFAQIPSCETSGVIKEEIGEVGAEAVKIKVEEDPGLSKFLVFSHCVKKESDEPN